MVDTSSNTVSGRSPYFRCILLKSLRYYHPSRSAEPDSSLPIRESHGRSMHNTVPPAAAALCHCMFPHHPATANLPTHCSARACLHNCFPRVKKHFPATYPYPERQSMSRICCRVFPSEVSASIANAIYRLIGEQTVFSSSETSICFIRF